MSRGKFYLDKSDAKICGVCAGIADYTGVDALWVRLGAVLLLLAGFPLVIAAYFAIALLAEERPHGLYSEEEELRLLRRMQARRTKRGLGLPLDLSREGRRDTARSGRLRADLADMDRRVADMEAHYTASNSRLAAEIDALR